MGDKEVKLIADLIERVQELEGMMIDYAFQYQGHLDGETTDKFAHRWYEKFNRTCHKEIYRRFKNG